MQNVQNYISTLSYTPVEMITLGVFEGSIFTESELSSYPDKVYNEILSIDKLSWLHRSFTSESYNYYESTMSNAWRAMTLSWFKWFINYSEGISRSIDTDVLMWRSRCLNSLYASILTNLDKWSRIDSIRYTYSHAHHQNWYPWIYQCMFQLSMDPEQLPKYIQSCQDIEHQLR